MFSPGQLDYFDIRVTCKQHFCISSIMILTSIGSEETSFRLFFECPFSIGCWNILSIHWNLNLQPLDMIIQARTVFGSHIEIFITACWTIWNARNGVIFDNRASTLASWKLAFKEELGLVCIKA